MRLREGCPPHRRAGTSRSPYRAVRARKGQTKPILRACPHWDETWLLKRGTRRGEACTATARGQSRPPDAASQPSDRKQYRKCRQMPSRPLLHTDARLHSADSQLSRSLGSNAVTSSSARTAARYFVTPRYLRILINLTSLEPATTGYPACVCCSIRRPS